MITASDIAEMTFEHYSLKAPWNDIIGKPVSNSSILMYSGPGSGKSTVALQIADECTRLGKVGYNVQEEGYSFTLQNKLERIGLTRSNIMFFECEDVEELKKEVIKEKFDFLFVDSYTMYDKRLAHFEEFRKWCKKQQCVLVAIVQTTKEGKFYGNADAAFNVDCVLEVTDGKPSTLATGKNRLGELYQHEVDLRAKPRPAVKNAKPIERENPKIPVQKLEGAGDSMPGDRGDEYWNGTSINVPFEVKPWHTNPENALEEFQLKGIEFGRWLNESERVEYLANSMQGLSNMAKVLGIPNAAIGVHKKVGIAFGARGRGGASAHYEPSSYSNINLTKERGARALAHEYGHAIDNLVTKKVGGNYITGGRSVKKTAITNGKDSKLRQLAEKFFKELYFNTDGSKSNYHTRLLNGTEYDQRRIEVFARIFDTYVWTLCEEQKLASNYLAAPNFGKLNPTKKEFEQTRPLFAELVHGILSELHPGKVKKMESPKNIAPSVIEEESYPFSIKDIPYQTAYRAHSGTSFSPEKRARSEQNEYVDFLKEMYDLYKKKAVNSNREKEFASKFSRYQAGYLKRYLDYLHSRNGLVSSMIAGPSNFPVARMKKKNNSIDKRLKELIDYMKKAEKYILPKINTDIKTGVSGSLEKLEVKLQKLEARQERMKRLNKAFKMFQKSGKAESLEKLNLTEKELKAVTSYDNSNNYSVEKNRIFPRYELVNNNARIRRVKQQIALEKKLNLKKKKGNKLLPFPGGEVELNYHINKIQIHFEEKPPVEIRSFLKERGHSFKWSPRNKVWQRQLNTYTLGARTELYSFLEVKEPEEVSGSKHIEKLSETLVSKDQPGSKSDQKVIGYAVVDNISGEIIASKANLKELETAYNGLEKTKGFEDMEALVYEIIEVGEKNKLGKKLEQGFTKKPSKQSEIRFNPSSKEHLVYLCIVEQLDILQKNSTGDTVFELNGPYFLLSDQKKKRLYVIPPRLVKTFSGSLNDSKADQLFKEWHNYSPDNKVLEISYPKEQAVHSVGTAVKILYLSDKIMNKGDRKGNENYYTHDFDAEKRPVSLQGDVIIIDNITWNYRGLLD